MSQVGQQLFRLSDAQLRAVTEACRPLQPRQRRAFLQSLADRLAGEGEGVLGDGQLHRTITELLKQHFDPPMLDGTDAA
jgi:hypothetical protein